MTVSNYSHVAMHVHPDHKTDTHAVVAKGGVLEIINDHPEWPEFEVIFKNSAPPSPNDVLTGSVGKPVVLHMPNEIKEYEFYVLYRAPSTNCLHEILRFARTCGPCP